MDARRRAALVARRRRLTRRDLMWSWMFVAVMAGWTHSVLLPSVGFDDAEITQAYARNLAAGHGYVWNVGGERVEGSTSLVWTLLNVPFFTGGRTGYAALATLCIALTTAIVHQVLTLGRQLAGDRSAVPVRLFTIAVLACFPTMFSWLIWSLMDVTLWCLLVVTSVFTVIRLVHRAPRGLTRRRRRVLLVTAGLLPLTRPEGIAVVVLLALVLIGLAWLRGVPRLRRWGLAAGATGLVTFGAVTAWRSSYFGAPFPNTYYAKASSDLRQQLALGTDYTIGFVTDPWVLGLLSGALVAGVLLAVRGVRHGGYTRAGAVIGTLSLAILALYTVLGGDHFGGHRFYAPVILIVTPLLGTGLARLRGGSPGTGRVMTGALAAAMVLSQVIYAKNDGYLRINTAVASYGQEVGSILDTIPDASDLTVGVIAAGGIRMTFTGDIFDLVGLNSVPMAHAAHQTANKLQGHAGFNRGVFDEAQPDIVLPGLGSCDKEAFDLDLFASITLEGLLQDPEFQKAYTFRCYRGVVFYAKRDLIVPGSLQDG